MQKVKQTTLALVGSLCLSMSAWAADVSASDASKVEESTEAVVPAPAPDAQVDAAAAAAGVPALSIIMSRGAKVHDRFRVGEDMFGWIIDYSGHVNTYYTTADGEYLVVGAVLDSDGINVAEMQPPVEGVTTGTQAAAGNYKQGLYERFEQSTYVSVERGEKEMFVIFEPQCPYCARLYQQMRHRDVTVHYMLVAFLGAQSRPLAETLLEQKAGTISDAMDSLVMAKLSSAPLPQWLARYDTDEEIANFSAKMAKNLQLMRDAGITGTPAIIYKDASGEVHIKRGLPGANAMDRIIASLPEEA